MTTVIPFSAEKEPEGKTQMRLSPKTYRRLLVALIKDDVDWLSEFLTKRKKRRSEYVNAIFAFEKPPVCPFAPCFYTVFLVAAEHASFACLRLLMENDAEIEASDKSGNLLHALIWAYFLWPERQSDILEQFDQVLQRLAATDSGRVGRMQVKEDYFGLRPFELTDSRRWFSPTIVVTYLTAKDVLKTSVTNLVLENEIFQFWLKCKTQRTALCYYIWFGLRLLYAISIVMSTGVQLNLNLTNVNNFKQNSIYSDSETVNANCTTIVSNIGAFLHNDDNPFLLLCVQAMAWFSTLFAVLCLTLNLIRAAFDWYTRRQIAAVYFRLLAGEGTRLCSNGFYNMIINVLHCMVLLVSAFSNNADLKRLVATEQSVQLLVWAVYAWCVVLAIWQLFYFLQGFQLTAYLTVALQSIMRDMAQFSLLYVAISFSFNQMYYSFNTLHCSGDDHPPLHYMQSWYDVFQLSLNVYSGSIVGPAPTRTIEYLRPLLHVTYVFVVAILLINFLIAIMSNTATALMEMKQYAIHIILIDILHDIELCMDCLAWAVPSKYKYLLYRGFIVKGDQIMIRAQTKLRKEAIKVKDTIKDNDKL